MKDFVFHEEALALKELGFDEPCLKFYANKKLVLALDTDNGDINSKLNQYNPLYVSAPTFSQAFRFFRKKKYHAEILWRGDFGDFCWKIGRFKYGSHLFSENGFKTYEEAELECLKKLIEIVKQKQ
jgi:hypothetical protein